MICGAGSAAKSPLHVALHAEFDVFGLHAGNILIVREVMLGDSLDVEGISARYEHGVLTISVPSRPDASPRKIEIETGATEGAIEAPSRESGRRSKSSSRSKRTTDRNES
jgi:hypothetical protein